MVCRSSRTDRRGLSAAEAFIGLAVAALLFGLAYSGLSTGLRLLARGESKLNATGQAELALRRLRADLAGAVSAPAVETGTIRVPTSAGEVSWTFRATANGRGSVIERAGASETSRFLAGALTAAAVVLDESQGQRSIAVTLASKGTHDAVAGEFCETYFVSNDAAGSCWNALP